jgi:hypothetical protein
VEKRSNGAQGEFRLTAWKIFLIVEWVALLIGLAMPITPSKTGGDFDFADLLFENPGYLQKALVDFLVVNVLIGVLALIFLLLWWRQRRKAGSKG